MLIEGEMPLWLILLDAVFIAVSVALLAWAHFGTMTASLVYPVVYFTFVLTGLKPVAYLAATQDPGPFYMAVVMLTGSLCFLSMRYLISGMAFIILAWLGVAMISLPTSTVVAGLAIILFGAAMSLFILHNRVKAAIGIYKLRERVQTLESILPMCASCKKTRDHNGKWQTVEEYIEDHQAGTQVSHGSCPSCTEELYGDLINKDKAADAAV